MLHTSVSLANVCVRARCVACLCQVVVEAPPGLKQNLLRTFASWSSDFLAGQPAEARRSRHSGSDGTGSTSKLAPRAGSLKVPPADAALRAQMLFLLAWFHGVLLVRRSYVPIVSVCVKSACLCAGITGININGGKLCAAAAPAYPKIARCICYSHG